jgi:hypothetical protein
MGEKSLQSQAPRTGGDVEPTFNIPSAGFRVERFAKQLVLCSAPPRPSYVRSNMR